MKTNEKSRLNLTERFLATVYPQMLLQMMLELKRLSALLALEASQVG